MFELIKQTWPWFIAGPAISVIFFLMLYFNKAFGVSSSFDTICSMGGAGKFVTHFKFNWKEQNWNLIFVIGMLLGGFFASTILKSEQDMEIGKHTLNVLAGYGIQAPTSDLVPKELFNWEALRSTKGLVLTVLGGFLIGFGTRYAGGCTSGHAISGLSNLQLPSLIAVIGFFIGGLGTVHFVFPYLLR